MEGEGKGEEARVVMKKEKVLSYIYVCVHFCNCMDVCECRKNAGHRC
jgi:hypothetical protein